MQTEDSGINVRITSIGEGKKKRSVERLGDSALEDITDVATKAIK